MEAPGIEAGDRAQRFADIRGHSDAVTGCSGDSVSESDDRSRTFAAFQCSNVVRGDSSGCEGGERSSTKCLPEQPDPAPDPLIASCDREDYPAATATGRASHGSGRDGIALPSAYVVGLSSKRLLPAEALAVMVVRSLIGGDVHAARAAALALVAVVEALPSGPVGEEANASTDSTAPESDQNRR